MNNDVILNVLDFVNPKFMISKTISKNYEIQCKTYFMIAFKEEYRNIWMNYPKSVLDPYYLCEQGELEMFSHYIEHADMDVNFEECFEGACFSGNTELVKYIYEETNGEGLYLYDKYNEGLVKACLSGNIDTVKYVLSIYHQI